MAGARLSVRAGRPINRTRGRFVHSFFAPSSPLSLSRSLARKRAIEAERQRLKLHTNNNNNINKEHEMQFARPPARLSVWRSQIETDPLIYGPAARRAPKRERERERERAAWGPEVARFLINPRRSRVDYKAPLSLFFTPKPSFFGRQLDSQRQTGCSGTLSERRKWRETGGKANLRLQIVQLSLAHLL